MVFAETLAAEVVLAEAVLVEAVVASSAESCEDDGGMAEGVLLPCLVVAEVFTVFTVFAAFAVAASVRSWDCLHIRTCARGGSEERGREGEREGRGK